MVHTSNQTCNNEALAKAVPDFGSGRKPAIFINLAQIQLRSKCSRIPVLARFAKWRIQILHCSTFYLVSKNCAVDVAIFSIRLFTLLRFRHHLATDKISRYEYFKYPSSLLLLLDLLDLLRNECTHIQHIPRSFMNKSQIRPRPQFWPDLCRQIRPNPAPVRITKPESGTALALAVGTPFFKTKDYITFKTQCKHTILFW